MKTCFPDVLRHRLIFYAAASLLVMAVCSTVLVTVTLWQSWKQVQEASLLYSAELKSQAAAEWMRKNRHLARQAAARTGMREELEALNKGQKNAEGVISFITGAIKDALRHSSDMVGVTRLNDKGKAVAFGGVPIPKELLIPAKPEENNVHFTPPLFLEGQECILLSTPIYNRSMEFIGTDIIAVSTDALHHLILGSTCLGIWQGGPHCFLHSPDIENVNTDPKKRSIWESALREALSGNKGVMSRGELVLAYVPVPDTPWGLVFAEDANRLYAPAWKNFSLVLVTIVFIYLLFLAGIVVLSRPLAGKILLHTHELEATINSKTKELKKTQAELEDRVAQRTESLRAANEALKQEELRRKEVAREIVNMLERVRSEISRDLHDHTGQLLTTLRLLLENIRSEISEHSPAQAARLKEAGRSVMMIQRSLKGIARGLRPPCLDYLGLIPSIKTLLEEYRAAGLKIFFFHKDIPQKIDNEVALAFYRIAQEALTNVLRHAEATTVHVNFTRQQDFYSLSIEDNGKGFDPAQKRDAILGDHFGLALMQERMLLLGGDYILESFPNKGTQIIARVPCEKE